MIANSMTRDARALHAHAGVHAVGGAEICPLSLLIKGLKKCTCILHAHIWKCLKFHGKARIYRVHALTTPTGYIYRRRLGARPALRLKGLGGRDARAGRLSCLNASRSPRSDPSTDDQRPETLGTPSDSAALPRRVGAESARHA